MHGVYTPFSRGLAKVKGDTHKIEWKIGTKLGHTSRGLEAIAMALKRDESRLAVLYHQPHPNTVDNYTDSSRLTLRVFDTSDGTHITSTSPQWVLSMTN